MGLTRSQKARRSEKRKKIALAKKRKRQIFRMVHTACHTFFPKAFPALDQPKPLLKVNIHLDLKQEFPGMSSQKIRTFLWKWTRHASYTEARLLNGPRVDLYGNPQPDVKQSDVAGAVSAE